jgi:anti-sigma regulatory factor (Ser/Thr protein kinase)
MLEAKGCDDVAAVRHAVAEFLARRGAPSTVVDDLELVVSELVTNALTHRSADRPVTVRVVSGEAISLEVANHGSAAEIPPVESWRLASPREMSGRGLGIVRRLCDEAAIRQDGDQIVVSCRRHLPDGAMTP